MPSRLSRSRVSSTSASSSEISAAAAEKPVEPNDAKSSPDAVNENGANEAKETKQADSASPPKEAEDTDVYKAGMRTGTKDLYAGKEDKKGRYQWQDTIPADMGVVVENDKTAECKFPCCLAYFDLY
jgi:hypothetical protein